jgi:RecA/RadA recombinase|tara:strand:- start:11236 stop:12273 length:1038 start_codon:yes stop_codon:yes gene_type:complete
MDKLKKNSTIKATEVLSSSKFFTEKDMTPTDVPMVNVALSGSIDGGVAPGLTILAGPSKHFKTSFALLMAGAYLKRHPDAIMLFYDSEFGSPESYFAQFGVDTERVLHVPVTNIEELKIDMVGQFESMSREDNVIVVIDSIGNLASKKELDDALEGKTVADMSRAKALKGLFRMVTPYLTMKNIPLLGINHTYKEIGLYPKDIVGGGTGLYYSSDNIWILGRQQEKKGTVIEGYHFIINVEKSRYVKEKSKIPITVTWEGGVSKYSGLTEVGLAGGYLTKPSNGWYAIVSQETGEIGNKVRYAETLEESFWAPIFEKTDFKEFVKKQYSIGYKSEVDMDDIVLAE